MSTTATSSPSIAGQRASEQDFAAVRARLAPALRLLAAGVIERDATRALPREGIAALAQAGVAALRVPVEFGGAGLSLRQLFTVLTDIAKADPNAAQALRGHLAFVEDRLVAAPGLQRESWFARFAAGELVGNAWTDAAVSVQGTTSTQVSRAADGEGWEVNGTKFYSTGSIFADWIDVYAGSDQHGEDVIALVATDQAGVTLSDDWDGFGQRTTGTGTTVFTAAAVEDVVLGSERFGYQTAFYQQVLLATLAGIARSLANEGAAALRSRVRGYSHGAPAGPAADPQLLQVIGELDATAFAAASIVDAVSDALEPAAAAAEARWGEAGQEGQGTTSGADEAAEVASARGQVTLSALVPAAATRLFDALGASGTSVSAGLDRHWRNARTASSHNPWVYKARVLGDALVNGAQVPRLWSVGSANPQGAPAASEAAPRG